MIKWSKFANKAKNATKKIKSKTQLPATGFGLGALGGFGTAGGVAYLMGYNKGKKKNGKKA